jgi:CelD/BcsL family acetyltransferase involved in cellulose biosynthesis
LSGNTRKQVRQTLRRYETRFGAASLERASTTAEARSWLQELIALHEKRWNARGLPGAFSTRLSRDFHDALVRSHVEGGDGDSRTRLDLLRLQFGGTTTGFIYNFVYRRRVSFYQGGFEYLPGDNKLRPGLVMHALAIERYLREGQLEYDFLGGEAGVVQYKRSLSTEIRRLAWTRLPVPGLKMSLLSRIRRLRRALRPTRKPAPQKP